MRHRYFLLVLAWMAAALLGSGRAAAQTWTVEVGNWSGTSSSAYGLFHFNTRYSWTQTLYPQGDLGDSGWVRALVFDNRSTTIGMADSVKIYLGHTTMATQPTPATLGDWLREGELQLVWSSLDFSVPNRVGQLYVELDEPFWYDGQRNLALVVSKAAQSASTGTKFGYTSTTGSMKYLAGADDSFCRFPEAAGTRGAYRQNLRLLMSATPDAPICLPVQGLRLTALDSTQASLRWAAATGASYEVAYAVDDSTATPASPVAVSDSGHTFAALQPGTLYRLYVRKVCGSLRSEWDSLLVRTPCGPMPSSALPYTEDFDLFASGTTSIPCWDHLGGGYVNTVSRTGFNGMALRFYPNGSHEPNLVAMPATADSIAGLELLFRTAPESGTNSGSFDVGWITHVVDTGSFVPVAHYSAAQFAITGSVQPQVLDVSFDGAPAGARIAFRHNVHSTSYYWFIDEVDLHPLPACRRPDSVSVTHLASDSATLVVSHPSASTFLLAVHAYGSPLWDTLAIGPTHTLSDLTPGTLYEGTVSTLCGSDTSERSVRFSFYTECSTTHLPVSLDAEHIWLGTASTPDIPCWHFINGGSTTYNWRQGTTVHSGARSYCYYGTTSTTLTYDDWMITPAFHFTGHDEMLLWLKSGSTYTTDTYRGRFALYATVDDSVSSIDRADFRQLALEGSDVVDNRVEIVGGDWRLVTLRLPDSLVGEHRLAFVVDEQSYIFYMDDIIIRPIAACPTPYGLELVDVGTDTALLRWSDSIDASSYELLYWPVGNPDQVSSQLCSDTTGLLTALLPNTAYQASVRALCGSLQSHPTYPLNFRTLCLPVPPGELPYVEDFEAYASGSSNPIDPCWYRSCPGSGNSYPYPISSGVGSAMGLRFLAYSSTSAPYYCYALLPEFETPLDSLQLHFDLKRSSTSSYQSSLRVGIMTQADDPTTFIQLQEYDLTRLPTSSVQHHRLLLDGLEDEGRIAFLVPLPVAGNQYNSIDLDNVAVAPRPACPWPTGLTADSIGAYGLRLAWQGVADSFEVQCALDTAFTSGLVAATSNSNLATLSGLLPYTRYHARVRGLCGAAQSDWSDLLSCKTLVDCGPSSNNLIDTLGHGTSTNSSSAFYVSSSTYPTGYSSSIFTMQELVVDFGLQANNRINGISLHSGSNSGTIRQAKIYLAETPLAAFGNPAANDTMDRATMTLVYSGDIAVTPESWIEIPFDTVFPYSREGNLLLSLCRDTNCTGLLYFYYSTQSEYLSAYGYRSSATTEHNTATRSLQRPNIVFNFCTEVPDCVRPTDVAVTSFSDTSATLAWNGSAPVYEVMWSTTLADPDLLYGSAPTLLTDTTCATLNGLASSTTYHYFVRSVCQQEHSEWTLAASLTTRCSALPLPYFEDFESYGSGTSMPIDPCWYKGTNSTSIYPYPTSANAITGQRSLYFYAYRPSSATATSTYSYAVLPRFQDSVRHLSLSFNVRRYSSAGGNTTRLVIGVMTVPEDIATFFPMDTLDLYDAPLSSVQGYEYHFDGYTGDGQFIAIYNEAPPIYGSNTSSYSYATLDNVMVETIPTCLRPTGITVDSIRHTSAIARWEAGTGTAWFEVEYGTRGFALGSGTRDTTSADSLLMTGLGIAQEHDVYVRRHCTDGGVSQWSFFATFATNCGPRSLPMFLDPEDYATGSSSIPHCWTSYNNGTSSYPYISTSSSNTHTGTKVIYYYLSSSTTEEVMVFPEVDTMAFPMSQSEVVFWAKSSVANRPIVVGVMTDPTDYATFQPVDTVRLTTLPREYTVMLNAFNGYGSFIALKGVRDTTASFYLYVDDVWLEPISACPRVYDLTATDATQHSAALGWSDTSGATAWRILYAPDSSNQWQTVDAATNPYTLTGLAPQGFYRFRVAPVCPSGSLGDWSRELHRFGTTQVPATVPYLYDFEDTVEWQHWQTLSNNSVNWYRGSATAADSGGHSMYISTDCGNTHSWNLALNTNAAAFRDIDFGPVPSSFHLDVDTYIGGATDAFYDGLVLMLVDPTESYEASSSAITTPWGHVNSLDWIGYARHDSVWTHHTFNINGAYGIRRLVFFHFNNAGTNHPRIDIPSAVDNLAIGLQPCQTPFGMSAVDVHTHSATLSWQGEQTTSYVVASRKRGAPAADNRFDTVTGPVTILTGLDPATEYLWWVQRICSLTATDTMVSDWSYSSSFTTLCATLSALDTLREDFELVEGTAYNVAGVLPPCWEAYTAGGTNGILPHVTNTGNYSYWVSGQQAVTLTAALNHAYGDSTFLRMPDITEPTNTLTLAYWFCTEGSAADKGVLSVGYMTGPSYENDFVALKSHVTSSATTHSNNGLQTGHGVRDTVSFASAPDGYHPIVFRWSKKTATFYSVCIDDIALWSNYTHCPEPTLTGVDSTYNSLHVSWQPADSTEVRLVEGVWNPAHGTTLVSTTGEALFSGLQPATSYTLGLRHHCPGGLASEWVLTPLSTTGLLCLAPDAPLLEALGYTSATLGWQPGADEQAWLATLANYAYFRCDTLFEPSFTANDLQPALTYFFSVAPLCGDNLELEGNPSPAIEFTTLDCLPVTGVSATADGRSVRVEWNPTPSDHYRLSYYRADFTTGGDTVEISGRNYHVIDSLRPGQAYDIYLYTYCTESLLSRASARVTVDISGIPAASLSHVALHPNPATRTVRISGLTAGATVTMADISGRECGHWRADGGSLTLDVEALPRGAYFVRIADSHGTAVRKLILAAD